MIVTWGGAVRQLLSKLSMRFGVIKFILVMQKTQEKVSVGIFFIIWGHFRARKTWSSLGCFMEFGSKLHHHHLWQLRCL